MVVVLFHHHLEMGHQDEFWSEWQKWHLIANQENNRLKYRSQLQIQLHVPEWNYFRFSRAILTFGVNKSPVKVGMRCIEKLTSQTWVQPLEFCSLGDTEPEIHLGVIYPSPNCNVSFNKYHYNTRFKRSPVCLKFGVD